MQTIAPETQALNCGTVQNARETNLSCRVNGQRYGASVDDESLTAKCIVPKEMANDILEYNVIKATEPDGGFASKEPEVKVSLKTVWQEMSWIDRLLPIWIIVAMVGGVLLGYYYPAIKRGLQVSDIGGVSLPIAIGLWWMMFPVLTKVRYELLTVLLFQRRTMYQLFISFLLNWIVGPALMTGFAWACLPDLPAYRNGVIMVGLARCIAMVLIWNQLARGHEDLCAVVVAFNSVLQIILYAPMSVFYLNVVSGGSGVQVGFWPVAKSVLLFLGIPLVAGILLRLFILLTAGRTWFDKRFLPYFGPSALLALVYTIIVMFASQGDKIVNDIGSVARVAVPMVIYFFVMFFSSLAISWVAKFEYSYAVTQAFTAASNNFELAIAVAVGTFGVDSSEALAATVGPLVEVPVLLALVYVALWFYSTFWHRRDVELKQPVLTFTESSVVPLDAASRNLQSSRRTTISNIQVQPASSGSGQTTDTMKVSIESAMSMEDSAGSYDYDLVVIGGGSGGMATAREAAALGAKVVLFDFVKPSTQNSKWGLGGTCVNVGCVPKKIMHYGALLGAAFHDAHELGWGLEEHPAHSWEQLVQTVQMHIKSLNFGYRVGLMSATVKYINALARFSGPHEVSYSIQGETKVLTAKYIVIAVGGRPTVPLSVPGAMELAITSDDFFSLGTSPGKTLCVGGGYVSLELAGLLTELGFSTTVAVRSLVLRGFDRQCAEKVASIMAEMGTRFMYDAEPSQLVKLPNGQIEVTLLKTGTDEIFTTEVFDTVVYATGRHPDVIGLNLEAAGLKTLKNGKFAVNDERTNVSHIFAVGDILQTRQELTPVAIKTGEMLARRLFGKSAEVLEYHFVPTTVFTPVEYGSVGYSEEEARAKFGADNVDAYLQEFTTLEISAVHRKKHPSAIVDEFDAALQPFCLAKLVVVKSENEKVVGFHFVGPNAGEVTQGFALSLKLGVTKKDFDNLVGIHPTDAEVFTQLTITRSSGKDFRAKGGCGGGKCG
eukprot:CAMPEP_0184655092 /NCGR_PEP_ID=MMETSP0308-20130426/12721_1 /TAXON_ID=38269 /ORGANISM="Gloeochaete witrockiana, Strain SAG 46.84" /LENGTH=1000 /DNA_ID=CAMNT_0027091361 /DNA_START=24 /DNA_END=3026 /DNA_ORIENTATION=+